MTNTQRNHEVAKTTYSQIGRMAFGMLGAKNIMLDGNSLHFRIGRNSKSVNSITVEYMPGSDTYTIRFQWIRVTTAQGVVIKTRAEVEGVYADSMHAVIEEHTGMYTSL